MGCCKMQLRRLRRGRPSRAVSHMVWGIVAPWPLVSTSTRVAPCLRRIFLRSTRPALFRQPLERCHLIGDNGPTLWFKRSFWFHVCIQHHLIVGAPSWRGLCCVDGAAWPVIFCATCMEACMSRELGGEVAKLALEFLRGNL